MDGADKDFRFINSDGNGFRVQAYASVGEDGADKSIIFRCDQIDYIFAGDREDTSGIRLNDGIVILVRLSQLELDSAIYRPKLDDLLENDVIDLTAVTKKSVVASNNQELTMEVPEIGAKMPDGTVCAGVSPDTHKPMYATPTDEPLEMLWGEAMKAAKKKDVYGHKDWRVPTPNELNILFQNQNKGSLKGTFNNLAGNGCPAHYWSSKKNLITAHYQSFEHGSQSAWARYFPTKVRCVRG